MIKSITLKKFKKFTNDTIDINPIRTTLIVGGNDSGKSTLIHALAIWEFCKMILALSRGDKALRQNYHSQGIGISADEFLPIAIPSLKHLWTNLKPQKTGTDRDGYTLRIGCKWDNDIEKDRYLEIGLSLANERLFIKTTQTNLLESDYIPNIAYMPTFAGVLEREALVTQAERKHQIGKGLSGSVIRNMIYELYSANIDERKRLKGEKPKISTRDLRKLRTSDPFEILQEKIRKYFSMELIVEPYNELYNTYLKIFTRKVKWNENIKRFQSVNNYNARDIMVQGNGFLQLLTVFPLALNSYYDVLLLDEPDAHLHSSLQFQLLSFINELIPDRKKQVIIATHSNEIVKSIDYSYILDIKTKKYLTDDIRKKEILLGLGGEYLPILDNARKAKKVLFLENESDFNFIKHFSNILNKPLPELCCIYTTESHKDRKIVHEFLKREIPDLKSISLRDRDIEHHPNSISSQLILNGIQGNPSFKGLYWKRTNIESYLLWPHAIARVASKQPKEVEDYISRKHCLSITDLSSFRNHVAPDSILRCDGKAIVSDVCGEYHINKFDVARNFQANEVCDDIIVLIDTICTFLA